MQVVVNGDVITIKSNIRFEDLKELGPVFVESEGKKIFGASVGAVGNISEVGVSFTYGDSEGHACLNAVTDLKSSEEIIKALLEEQESALANLNKYEDAVNEALDAKRIAREAVAMRITIG